MQQDLATTEYILRTMVIWHLGFIREFFLVFHHTEKMFQIEVVDVMSYTNVFLWYAIFEKNQDKFEADVK